MARHDDPDLRPIGDDDDLEDWEVLPPQTEPAASAVVSARFEAADARLLMEAARIRGLTPAEYVRQCAMADAASLCRQLDTGGSVTLGELWPYATVVKAR